MAARERMAAREGWRRAKKWREIMAQDPLPADMPPGWHMDPDTGFWLRDTIHHMGRRCLKWDYRGTACYLITLVLRDRSRPLLGKLHGPSFSAIHGGASAPYIAETKLGQLVGAHFRRIPEFSPEIEVLGVQIMPEHLHGVLRVIHPMEKPLGEHLRGFKIGTTKFARNLGIMAPPGPSESLRGQGLFADGFVDTILSSDEAVHKGLAYMADNPRRLWEKRTHPDLFRVVRDLPIRFSLGEKKVVGHFSAIGNHHLLGAPQILQVQCSRQDFEYARDEKTRALMRERAPVRCTETFCEKAEALLAAASHGAVLASPCISHGEKEIARRTYEQGHRVIALCNKGFSPLFKPSGKLFDSCVQGNLLMLAPAAWEYVPGERNITRMDACALNRIAQLLSGSGAVEIQYRGTTLADVDAYAMEAMRAEFC